MHEGTFRDVSAHMFPTFLYDQIRQKDTLSVSEQRRSRWHACWRDVIKSFALCRLAPYENDPVGEKRMSGSDCRSALTDHGFAVHPCNMY